MSVIVRTWLAFAALGVGLIHLALVVSAPLPVALALGAMGFTELAWAVLTLRRQRVAAPRIVLFAALLPVVLWLALITAGSARDPASDAVALSPGALAIAAALELFVAVVIAIHLRRGSQIPAAPRVPPPWLYLTGLMAGALVVGSLVTPALASTAAGEYAQPHGEHVPNLEPPHRDDHR